MNIDDGYKNISAEDSPGFVDILVTDISEYVVRELLNKDPEEDDTRSQTVAIRFPNGDLVLGFYPQGDSYEDVTQHWGV